MTDRFSTSDHLADARLARFLPLALLADQVRRGRFGPRPHAAGRPEPRLGSPLGPRLARALALPLVLGGVAAALSGCAAGPGLLPVPVIGSMTGGIAPLTQASLASGIPMEQVERQCALMAQVAADPSQPAGFREQMRLQVGMLGCPG